MNSSHKIALFALCCLGLAACGGRSIHSASARLPPPYMPSSTTDDSNASLRSRTGRENTSSVLPPVRQPEPEPVSGPVPDPLPINSNDIGRASAQLRDVYFDYNRSAVNAASVPVLAEDLEALQYMLKSSSGIVTIEGHADDRGSEEFNLALADHRATAVKEFLVQRGLPAQRLNTLSYGKEKPQCMQQNEACWSRNRRAHFAGGQ